MLREEASPGRLSVPAVINEEQAEERVGSGSQPSLPCNAALSASPQEGVGILCHADPAACLFATLRFCSPCSIWLTLWLGSTHTKKSYLTIDQYLIKT